MQNLVEVLNLEWLSTIPTFAQVDATKTSDTAQVSIFFFWGGGLGLCGWNCVHLLIYIHLYVDV